MMKKSLLLLIPLFISCGDKHEVSITEKEDGARIEKSYGILGMSYDLYELEFKGHTYIYCEVRDGIALTHAGHCKCNDKK